MPDIGQPTADISSALDHVEAADQATQTSIRQPHVDVIEA